MVEFCGSSTPSEIPKTTISKSVKSASSVSVGCFLSNDARVSVHDLSGRQTGKLKTLVSCIILYKPNEEKQNFWWITVLFLKKQWFVSFQNTAHDICLTEGDSTKKMPCLMSSKKRWSWPTCKKGESRESKVKDKHPGNSMPMFGIPNPLQDSILTGTWREPSCLGVPFWGGVNTVKACFLFICNNRCKFAVRTLHFGTPNPPSTLLFLQGSQRDWKSPLDVPQKTTGTQRLWAKDASVPRAKVGMSTDLMCPPKKKRS